MKFYTIFTCVSRGEKGTNIVQKWVKRVQKHQKMVKCVPLCSHQSFKNRPEGRFFYFVGTGASCETVIIAKSFISCIFVAPFDIIIYVLDRKSTRGEFIIWYVAFGQFWYGLGFIYFLHRKSVATSQIEILWDKRPFLPVFFMLFWVLFFILFIILFCFIVIYNI